MLSSRFSGAALVLLLSTCAAFAQEEPRELMRRCKGPGDNCRDDKRCCGDLVCGRAVRYINKQGARKFGRRCVPPEKIPADGGLAELGAPPQCVDDMEKCRGGRSQCCTEGYECTEVERVTNKRGDSKMEVRCVPPEKTVIGKELKCTEPMAKCMPGKRSCCPGEGGAEYECASVTRFLPNKQGAMKKENRCVPVGQRPDIGKEKCLAVEESCTPRAMDEMMPRDKTPGMKKKSLGCCGEMKCMPRKRLLNRKGDTKTEFVCADPTKGPKEVKGFCVAKGDRCSQNAPCCGRAECIYEYEEMDSGKDAKDEVDAKEGKDDSDEPNEAKDETRRRRRRNLRERELQDAKDDIDGKDGKDDMDGKDMDDGKDGKDMDDMDDGKDGKDDGKDGKDMDDMDDGKDGKDDGKDSKDMDDMDDGKDGKDMDDMDDGKDMDDMDDGKDGKDMDDGKDGKDMDDMDDGKDGKDMDDGKDGQDVDDGKDGKDMDDERKDGRMRKVGYCGGKMRFME